jgi:hypothetical protein
MDQTVYPAAASVSADKDVAVVVVVVSVVAEVDVVEVQEWLLQQPVCIDFGFCSALGGAEQHWFHLLYGEVPQRKASWMKMNPHH